MSKVNGTIAIIGSGIIGRSFALLFGSHGYKIHLYDSLPAQLENCLKIIQEEIKNLANIRDIEANFLAHTNLKSCIEEAFFVMECIPENLELKRKVFEQIDSIMGERQILASSTSTLLPSLLSKDLKHKNRMLVCHPVNPPNIIPIVEVIPAPWTDENATIVVRDLLKGVGKKPIVLKKEIPGFIVNRLQYAILNECYNLINDDVLSVEDVDDVMSEGLCVRWAFLGPLQVAHLNANGWDEYCEKYRKTIKAVSDTFDPVPLYGGQTSQNISQQLQRLIPLDELVSARGKLAREMKDLLELKKKHESS